MGAVVLSPVTRWYCPACRATDVTTEARPHSRFHTCPKLGFMAVPMVREGTKAKLEMHEIEGYVGKELVQYDADRRPVMNITTTRDDGQDCTVYAPTATASIHDLMDDK